MTIVEITLVAIALILVVILVNQTHLSNLAVDTLAQNKKTFDKILIILTIIYRIFRKARRFSAIYVFKNNFSQIYLAVTVIVVFIKILLYKSASFALFLPIEIEKIVNFLILSSAWEIACVVTKIIDNKMSHK